MATAWLPPTCAGSPPTSEWGRATGLQSWGRASCWHRPRDATGWEAVSALSPGSCKRGSSSLFPNMVSGDGWTEHTSDVIQAGTQGSWGQLWSMPAPTLRPLASWGLLWVAAAADRCLYFLWD